MMFGPLAMISPTPPGCTSTPPSSTTHTRAPRIARPQESRRRTFAGGPSAMCSCGGKKVSSGAACSSGKVAASHVLAAMGVAPDAASEAIRVSLGWTTTEAEVDGFADAWNALAARKARAA